MANSNGWGDGAANNSIGWGQGANNAIAWGDSHAKSWAGATDIVGLTTDPAASAYFTATGITGATQQTAIDNLVKGLKQDGLWSKMKAVYPFVTDNRNLFSYTEDFGNAFWYKNAVTITTNTVTAPNGTLTADSIVENTVNTDHYVGVLSGLTLTAVPYTLSIYLKKAGRDWFSLGLYNGTDSKYAWFNLNTGTIGTINSGVTANIESVGNGWYRCSVTRTMAANSNNFIGIVPTISDGGGAYLGNGSTSTYIWGAQLELGSTATTYQPIATTQQAFISNQFKYNLVNPVDSDAAFRLVFNGGWTHSANGGTPNGTNGYADTKLNENTAMTLNNIHMSFYSRTNSTIASCDIGCLDASTLYGTHIIPYSSGNAAVRNTDLSSGFTATANTLGLFINSRISSAQTKYFYNASLFNTIVSPSLSKSNQVYFLGARNTGGTASIFSPKQLAFSTIGDGLTDTEAANLYTRVQAFQTALSRQV